MHGQNECRKTKRKERERKKHAGSKRKKTEGREWAGGTVEERRRRKALTSSPIFLSWNQQPSLLLGPAFPSNRRTLAEPCPSPRPSYSLQPWKNGPILSYKMNVLFGQKRKGENLMWKKSGFGNLADCPPLKKSSSSWAALQAGRQSQQQHWSWRQGYGQETWGLVREPQSCTHTCSPETALGLIPGAARAAHT